jgi:hypothetical protein
MAEDETRAAYGEAVGIPDLPTRRAQRRFDRIILELALLYALVG